MERNVSQCGETNRYSYLDLFEQVSHLLVQQQSGGSG